MNYDTTKSEIKELINLLDSYNFERLNSVPFARLITEIKVLLEDLAEKAYRIEPNT